MNDSLLPELVEQCFQELEMTSSRKERHMVKIYL